MSQAAVRPATLRARALRTLATLAPIARVYEACGAPYEALRDALAGVGGVTADEFELLEGMAERWRRLDSRLQHLFIKHVDDQSVSIALWFCLADPEGRTDLILEGTIRKIGDLWTDEFGYPPSIVFFSRRQ